MLYKILNPWRLQAKVFTDSGIYHKKIFFSSRMKISRIFFLKINIFSLENMENRCKFLPLWKIPLHKQKIYSKRMADLSARPVVNCWQDRMWNPFSAVHIAIINFYWMMRWKTIFLPRLSKTGVRWTLLSNPSSFLPILKMEDPTGFNPVRHSLFYSYLFHLEYYSRLFWRNVDFLSKVFLTNVFSGIYYY